MGWGERWARGTNQLGQYLGKRRWGWSRGSDGLGRRGWSRGTNQLRRRGLPRGTNQLRRYLGKRRWGKERWRPGTEPWASKERQVRKMRRHHSVASCI